MTGTVTTISSVEQYTGVVAAARASVLYFRAEWCAPCAQLDQVIEALAKRFTDIAFLKIEAEDQPEISEKNDVMSVPTFVLFLGSKETQRVEGVHVAELTSLVEKLSATAAGVQEANSSGSSPTLTQRLEALINKDKIVLFMKGNAAQPRCGFSSQMVNLLNEERVPFSTFDILSDEQVRDGLKKYSNWPTYPQLYCQGKLVGGLDVVKELREDGSLRDELHLTDNTTLLNARLEKLVKQDRVMLFMKGNPDAPRCGFSSKIVNILREAGVQFGSFDILTDETVRQGLKEYSKWPTFPQLYSNGKLVGGLDVVKELHEDGQLMEELGL